MAKETYFYNGDVLRELGSNPSEPNKVTIHTAQNVESVIEAADQMREENAVVGHRKSRNMVPVAEVPMIIYEQAFREGWLHDKKKWRQWLNDPQNKCFRITDGRM